MKRLFFLWAFGLFLLTETSAQFAAERSGMNNLEKGKWDKARSHFLKAMRKDSLNAVAHYGLSVYFFTPENPDYQIDSAYQEVLLAMNDYTVTPVRDQEKMRRFPLDSIILVNQKASIDSAAFIRAKDLHSEAGYIFFIEHFTSSAQLDLAKELRNEVAFTDALKENTYQSYWEYLQKYPNSARAKDAQQRYDKLLYESKTSDKLLSSYETFLQEFPETPYRSEVEVQIFEIATASGEITDFEKFLKKYPKSVATSKVKNILYYLYKDHDQAIPTTLLNDSLRRVQSLERQLLVPFFQDHLFGMMNSSGEEIIKPIAESINEDYLCGNVLDDILIMGSQIITRNNKVLFKGPIKQMDEFGAGLIKVTSNNCIFIIHKSGWFVKESCSEDARFIDRRFIAFKEQGKWSVWTLTGRQITTFDWQDIDNAGEVVIFKKGSKFSLTHINTLAGLANRQSLTFMHEVDEIKPWRDGMLWIRKGNEQGVVSSNLAMWIPLKKQELTPESFGALSKSDYGYKLVYRITGESQTFSQVKVNKPWVAGYDAGSWKLIDTSLRVTLEPAFDSIAFIGPFAVTTISDTTRVYFNSANSLIISQQSRLSFIPGKDSLFFLLVDNGDKKILYDGAGEHSFLLPFDKIDNAGNGLLIITKKDKKGVATLDGKIFVQPEYDAIGSIQNGKASVLKNKKFGLIDLVYHKEIKPVYEKNISFYNEALLKAFKGNGWGLIDWKTRSVMNFEFEEILFWNDSTALAKKNFQWILYNFIEKKIVLDKIKDFKWVLNTEKEKILIIHQENNYGVISNRRGEIIPITFSDIINLGSETHPFYFTEKHVEEASIFVVIYYSEKGELIKRQVFEIDDYERIYCSDN